MRDFVSRSRACGAIRRGETSPSPLEIFVVPASLGYLCSVFFVPGSRLWEVLLNSIPSDFYFHYFNANAKCFNAAELWWEYCQQLQKENGLCFFFITRRPSRVLTERVVCTFLQNCFLGVQYMLCTFRNSFDALLFISRCFFSELGDEFSHYRSQTHTGEYQCGFNSSLDRLSAVARAPVGTKRHQVI